MKFKLNDFGLLNNVCPDFFSGIADPDHLEFNCFSVQSTVGDFDRVLNDDLFV